MHSYALQIHFHNFGFLKLIKFWETLSSLGSTKEIWYSVVDRTRKTGKVLLFQEIPDFDPDVLFRDAGVMDVDVKMV